MSANFLIFVVNITTDLSQILTSDSFTNWVFPILNLKLD